MSTFLDRVADAGGVLYLLLAFPGYVFLVAPHTPESLDSPDAVLAHLQAHPPTTSFWVGVGMEAAGLAALLFLAARLASRIGRTRPGWWLPTAAVGLAVAAFAVKVGSFAPGLAALDLDRYDAGTVTALLAINGVSADVATALDGACVLLLGIGALESGAFPRWLSALTAVAGGALLVTTAVPALDLQLVFLVWLLVVSGWLLARGSRVRDDAARPTPAGTRAA